MKQFIGGLAVAGAIGYGVADHYKSEQASTARELQQSRQNAENQQQQVADVRRQLALAIQDKDRYTFLANGLTPTLRARREAQFDQTQAALAARLTAEGRARDNARIRLEYENCIGTFRTLPTVEEHLTGQHHCFTYNSRFTVAYNPTTHYLTIPSYEGNPPYVAPAPVTASR